MHVKSVLAIAAAALLLLSACAAPEMARNNGKSAEAPADPHALSFTAGDCLDLTGSGAASGETVVPCSEPHDEEAFYTFDLSGGAFPGDDPMWTAVEQNCGPQFEMFIGLEYTASALDWFFHAPDRQSWDAGARTVVCVVYDPVGKVTGSLAGAVR